MHGRPRKAPTPEEQRGLAEKAAKLRPLQSQFLQNHHSKIYTKEALEISAKLLEANPEHYTAWNYRKLAVEHNLGRPEAAAGSDFIDSVFAEELRVAESALKRNYKSYGAWHHRKWVLSKGHSSTDRELRLLNLYQRQDTRNFHTWNYRRFITALKSIPAEQELQFTTDMINENFSNYSAWHNRSVLLSHLLEEKAQGYFPKEKILAEEYEFVRNALFTDPDDQSGWFYHLWLVDQTVKVDAPMLVSSWPPHDYDFSNPKDCTLDDGGFFSYTAFKYNTGKFPLVLYFSEAVEGINASTVTLEAEYDIDTNLTWTPLSTYNSVSAQAWVTHLNIPDKKINFPKAFPVKVSLGHSQGIISSSGIPYSHRSCITVYIPLHDSQKAEGQKLERILWTDENFCNLETPCQKTNPLNSVLQLRIKEEIDPTALKWNVETIANEIAHCRELLSWSTCKIGKLTLARLLMAHGAMMVFNSPDSLSMVHFAEVLELYRSLIELDPTHSQYYKDEYSLVFLKKVILLSVNYSCGVGWGEAPLVASSIESMLGYCHQYRDSTPLSTSGCLCLRLSNLSLSRIGSVEKFLWLQMLDLSHNQLRSIEGLEAMQLLSFLNLSNNKIGSFTALDPLRLLKSLEVLDISYNEIGSHTVDTRRYLCTSPLSHTVGSDWNFEEFRICNDSVTNYWEAFSLFRDLNLTELDIVGNAVADDKFKSFLHKLLPGLKWLDSEVLL
ncbi:hypothetical protein RJ639_031402 [Escallonia herrerae]|uniref:Geranylgeranyl transferase type-2 subunit alpha n=1 Tax=Escallonia herrerae TaxID=1293975 RepID=A0AA88X2C4_9ASTE|nr:hypothetical protein RJ639_031402 [Escallonia herrerae]